MANLFKLYLKDKLDAWMILIQIMPFFLVNILLINLGYKAGNILPDPDRVIPQILYLGLSLALIILINEPGWNILMGVSHSLISGIVLHWTNRMVVSWQVVAIAVWVGLSLLISQRMDQSSNRLSRGLLIIAVMLFSCGWFLIDFGFTPDWVRAPWMMIGLILFGVCLAVEFQQARNGLARDEIYILSVRLYLISLTMLWIFELGVD